MTNLTGKILVIDDDEGVLLVARLQLNKAGYDVLEARDGREGLISFAAHHNELALVLLDKFMPHVDGAAVIEQIRAQYGPDELPIVLMSGFSVEEAMRGIAPEDVYAFLQKPFRARTLHDVVTRAIQSVDDERRHKFALHF